MDYHNEGQTRIWRNRFKEFTKRFQSAGRCTDANNRKLAASGGFVVSRFLRGLPLAFWFAFRFFLLGHWGALEVHLATGNFGLVR